MRKIIAALSLCTALLLSSVALAEGGTGAIGTLERSHAKLTALIDAGAEAKALEQHVDQLLDYHWIATAALGGPDHYAERCGDRCEELERLLAQLIRKSYLARILKSDKGTVEILGEHARTKATKVDTKVTYANERGEHQTLAVDYVMHEVDGKWQVRDIITEGVSLAKNYRFELGKLYEAGGIDRVLSTLRNKLAELDAD